MGREGLKNRRIVWIILWGSVTPPSADWEQEARGYTRAVLRANKGEESHMAVTGAEVGDGWAWSCSRKTSKQVRRREKQKPVQKGNHGLSATRFRSEQDSQTEQSSGSNGKDDGRRRKGTHTPPAPHL